MPVGWEEEPQSDAAVLVAQVSDYAIIGLDPQGTITTWNLGAEKLKGYTADEAIGAQLLHVLPRRGPPGRTAAGPARRGP